MKLYVYDFDGTIFDGDSSYKFIFFLMKKKKKLLFKLPKMGLFAIKYKMKLISKEEMKECFFSIVKYFDNIDSLVEEFWSIYDKNIKDFFKEKKSHKNDIIASASPFFLLEPIKNKYKVMDLFASPIDKKTGKYNGINCYGVEKLRLFNNKYPNFIIEEMYSDNAVADRPLLEEAKKSFIVKKNKIIPYSETKNKSIFKKFINWCFNIYHKNEEIYNYLIVGVLTTLVSLVVYYACVLTFLNPKNPIELQVANILSWVVAVVFAYVTNRVFVFKSKEKNKLKEATKFVSSRLIVLDMLTMFIFVSLLHLNDKIGKVVSQIIVIVGNYIISKLFVFKNK